MALDTWVLVDSGTPTENMVTGQYKEYRESGKENYSTGNSGAVRVFLVAWDVRADFLDDCLGYSYLDGELEIHRILPDPHPEIENFYASEASVEGLGVLGTSEAGSIQWTTAKITVPYRPLPYAVETDADTDTELDRYVQRMYAFNADYLTINGVMKFATSGKVLSNPPGRITGTQELTYLWHEVPGKSDDPFSPPNIDTVDSCYGKVNSSSFDDYPAGTMLFLGCDPQMVTPRLASDNFYWNISLKFLHRDNGIGADGGQAGHNYIYDVANARWDKLVDNATGTHTIYETADLNTLFTIT